MPPLSCGEIIYIDCDWLSKPKYLLLVNDGTPPLFFYINTKKLKIAEIDPATDADFLKVTKTDYPFLDYDSWLDCGDVCEKFNWQSIEYEIRNGHCKKHGRIKPHTLEAVLQQIGNTERLSTTHQMLATEGLKSSHR